MRFTFRSVWIKRFLLVLSPILLIAIILGSVFAWLFIPWVPDPDFEKPNSQAEAYTQDLDYLIKYPDYEKAFDDSVKRNEFIEYINSVKPHLNSISAAKFELVVARAVAFADNGHTNVSPIGRSKRVNHLPVRTGPFEDGEFVLQATREHQDLLGAEIISIDEVPIEEVTKSFIPYFGGIERRARFFTHLFINSPELLHAQGISKAAHEVDVTFRLRDSTVVDRHFEGINPSNEMREPFGREIMDYRVPAGDQGNWVHLMDGTEPPLYLSEPDKPYLYTYLDTNDGAYVKINFNYDVGGYSLTDWLENVEGDLKKHEPRFAIVDLRFNGGGTDATASFSKHLPELIKNNGPIYILISRETFSAAIAAVAQFKKFGGDRVHIVGSPVGDRLRFVANGGTLFTLPNSKISIPVWSTYEDYETGCMDWTECFWLSPFFMETGVGEIDPDIFVPVSFKNYITGKDVAFEACISHFNNHAASLSPD